MKCSSNLTINVSEKYRLVGLLAASVLLHAIVLFQVRWDSQLTPPRFQQTLTVNLGTPLSARQEKTPLVSKLLPVRNKSSRVSEQAAPSTEKISLSSPTPGVTSEKVAHLDAGQQLNQARENVIQEKIPLVSKSPPVRNKSSRVSEQAAPSTEKISLSSPTSGVTSEKVAHLDVGQLLNQARENAIQEQRSAKPDFPLSGDYYGTYTGGDAGTFYVHLDNAGHALGVGESSRYGVVFNITGDATADGIIQMSSTGIAGVASFRGKLDLKTRMISGSWVAGSIGSGTFSGQHERN